jgi:ribosomal protein L37AE/L43A
MHAKEFLKNKGFAFETLGKSKANNISVTELMEEYSKQCIDQVKGNSSSDIQNVSCGACQNPYPHRCKDGSYYCEECTNTWR